MNTNKVYFAVSSLTTRIEYEGDLGDYYFGQGIQQHIVSHRITPVLVVAKESMFGKFFLKDLNINVKYTCKLPTSIGKVFVRQQSLIPFNEITGNTKKSLSKRKIKKLGSKQYEKYLRDLEEE